MGTVAAIARLFSAGIVQELARKGQSAAFVRLVDEAKLLEQLNPTAQVRDVFDAAFSILRRKSHRHEYIYKAALAHKILLGAHSLQTASMLTEFRVGPCKADLVILNGTATVYEIKSERDSLSRLRKQLAEYCKVFAKAYVIAGDNHVDAILRTTAEDVGVMRLSDRHQISTVREAEDRPERVVPAAVFDCLRIGEAKQVLASAGIDIPNVPNTEMASALRDRFIHLRPVDAHSAMVRVLKATRNLMPLAAVVEELPRSLQPAVLAVRMRKGDRTRLVQTVKTPIADAMNWK